MVENNKLLISTNIKKQLLKLSNDSIHGSTFITKKAINIVRAYLIDSSKSNTFSIIKLRKFLYEIVQSQPSMALVFNFSNQLLWFLDSIDQEKTSTKDQVFNIMGQIDNFESSMNQTEQIISELAAAELSSLSPIATFSSSNTVKKTIELLANKQKDLLFFCSESRPKNEGTILAKSLSKKGIHVSLMTDVTLFSLIKKVNAIIIGADAVTRHGIINKMGSNPLVNLANNKKIPVYCLCSAQKMVPLEYSLQKENKKPSSDLLNEQSCFINVINYYFDTTPSELFTGIITEKGIIKPERITDYLHEKTVHPIFLTST